MFFCKSNTGSKFQFNKNNTKIMSNISNKKRNETNKKCTNIYSYI